MTLTEALMNQMAQQLAALTNAFATIEQQRMQEQAVGKSEKMAARQHIVGNFVRAQDFIGKAEDWNEWAFAFKRSIRSQSKVAYELMSRVELIEEDLDEIDLTDEEDGLSGELYDVMCQVCKGEALTVIRNVPECHGARAWQKLFKKYNSKTVARMIKLLGEVTAPAKVTDVRFVESWLNQWEGRVVILEKDFEEKFTEAMRIAIVVNAMSTEIQEYVYANLRKNLSEEGSYKVVASKVRVIAGNKAAMLKGGTVAMDIGAVGNDSQKQDYEEDDVNALGMHSQCFNCGGWGHAKRECPTPLKGAGKGVAQFGGKSGFKGGGKGGYKGGYAGGTKGYQSKGDVGKGGGYGKGVAENSKGGGKGFGGGYQGTVFNCGLIGHKKAECRRPPMSANAVEEQDETELAEVNADEVWWIGAVHSYASEELEKNLEEIDEKNENLEEEWQPVKKKKGKHRQGLEQHPMVHCGPFRCSASASLVGVGWDSTLCGKPHTEGSARNHDPIGGLSTSVHVGSIIAGEHPSPTPAEGGRMTINCPFRLHGGVAASTVKAQNKTNDIQKEEEVLIMPIDMEPGTQRLTRESAMKFNEADVRKPLASAASVARAGNRIVMEEDGGYIENKATGERMKVRVDKNTFVYDVQLEDGTMVVVTLDSGAGCNVWPRGLKAGRSKLMPQKLGIKMLAANGTEIENYGQRVVKFRGIDQDQKGNAVFQRHM